MVPDLDDLVALLARGISDVSFTGVFVHDDSEGVQQRWRVWRRGRLARIEDPPGTLVLVAGHRTYWRSWPTDPGVVAIPRSSEQDDFELGRLTMLDPRGYWREWLRQDPAVVLSSLGATTHEGRPAWRFDAPTVKGGVPTLTVDAELGLVLRAERADIGALEYWTGVRTDIDLGDALFRYEGPCGLHSGAASPEEWLPG